MSSNVKKELMWLNEARKRIGALDAEADALCDEAYEKYFFPEKDALYQRAGQIRKESRKVRLAAVMDDAAIDRSYVYEGGARLGDMRQAIINFSDEPFHTDFHPGKNIYGGDTVIAPHTSLIMLSKGNGWVPPSFILFADGDEIAAIRYYLLKGYDPHPIHCKIVGKLPEEGRAILRAACISAGNYRVHFYEKKAIDQAEAPA